MMLILVRHGLPERAHMRDAVNPPLSEHGRLQARQTADRLEREAIVAIYSSPLLRAVETAEPLSRALGLPIRSLPAIGEVDNGEDTYISPEAIREAGDWERFIADPIGYYGHDEAEFRARVTAGFGSVLEAADGGRVALFTHGFPINILLALALGIDSLTAFVPRNGSITRFMGRSLSDLQVLSVNETSHFDRSVTS